MAEKKLENVNVRMCESMVDTIDALANSAGMNRSEWICTVLDSAVERERLKYEALHSIFGERRAANNESSAIPRNAFSGMSEDSDSPNQNLFPRGIK